MVTELQQKTLGVENADTVVDNLVTKDGDVLGGLFKLPPVLKFAYQVFIPEIKGKVATFGSDVVTKYGEKALTAAHVPNAVKVAEVAGMTVGYATPYLDSIGDLNKTRKVHQANTRLVLEDIAPLLAANKDAEKKGLAGSVTGIFKTGYEGNFMIERALEEVKKITYHDLTSDATKLIPNIAVNYNSHIENQLEKAKNAPIPDTAAIKEHEKKIAHIDWAMRASGLLQTGAEEAINGKNLKQTISELSFGKVLEIRDYIHENELDTVKASESYDLQGHKEQLTRLVEDAFQQFQTERGRKPLPTHRLHEVSKEIAKELVTGDMNALSLFNIIGREEVLNDSKNSLVREDKVKAVIAKEIKLFSKGATMDVEAFFNDVNYTLADIQSQLKSKDKDERALVVFLHDDPILLKAGLKKDEIEAMRKQFPEHLAEKMIGGVFSALAAMPDKELLEKNYTPENIDLIRSYAENPGLLKQALQSHDHEEDLKNLVRTEVMGQGPDFVKEIIAKGANGGSKLRKLDAGELEAMPPYTVREETRREMDEAPYPGRN